MPARTRLRRANALARPSWRAVSSALQSRTSQIRNGSLQGAVAGTPGTNPTNWTIPSVGGNITAVALALGTENRIEYIDVTVTASAAVAASILFDKTTGITAADGQTWTSSAFVKLAGGSLSNVSLAHRVQFRTVAGAQVTINDVALVPITALSRIVNTFTASGVTIERVTNGIAVTFSGAGSITLRIGGPMMHQGVAALSPIRTAGVARSGVHVSAGR